MATKAVNIESIEKALGEPWAKTRERLEAAGGASASHKELADALYPQFDGVVDKHGWWVQGAVVAYEQEIGRRVPGQRADGTFDVAVSRTIVGQRSDLVAALASHVDGSLNGVALSAAPRTSETAKRSFWRANLEDGTKIEIAAETKTEDRSLVVITASKLPSPEALEDWRAFLKGFLQQF
ncbi:MULTISPECIES: hypothetical protein [unclassified Brevibacterium]|uniref:hypothetical protein n=1 Tax=unclassified Brevibacterium TaxID=2614124 RepID=UPI001E423A10|nr:MULTISPECIES: hypothetical protein [unclassified Brevibacterium]MCD1287092.1 hypothetical protein [Brevibacterium sp. CCUG 69071]MDK8436320.1 hypothetical protein [Brevibacterium sp. H-BE7]